MRLVINFLISFKLHTTIRLEDLNDLKSMIKRRVGFSRVKAGPILWSWVRWKSLSSWNYCSRDKNVSKIFFIVAKLCCGCNCHIKTNYIKVTHCKKNIEIKLWFFSYLFWLKKLFFLFFLWKFDIGF